MANWRKFKRLVHYACALCDDTSKLGATKLNKVLWYSDTFAYRLTGKSISGETYLKRQYGPVPARILRALRELEGEGILHVRESAYFGKPKREYVVLKPANPSVFSEEEREIVRQVVDIVCNEHTAASISDLSHDEIWDAAEIGEEIPLYTVLAANAAPVTKADEAWANTVIKRRSEKLEAA